MISIAITRIEGYLATCLLQTAQPDASNQDILVAVNLFDVLGDDKPRLEPQYAKVRRFQRSMQVTLYPVCQHYLHIKMISEK